VALELVVAAMALALLSSASALLRPSASRRGQALSCLLMVAAMIAGLAGAGLSLSGAATADLAFPWQATGGSLIGMDALSAFFLVPVFLVGGLGSVYGLGYWPRSTHPRSARYLETFWGLLVAGLALLVVARHALAFLLGWEVMALSAFFLVATEDFRGESRRASLVYLMATHVGTLALFGLFVLWHKATGSFAFLPVAGQAGTAAMDGIFLLALLGFGLKAGVMPLHFWLPGAHAAAPSHVSAMLSGIVLKMGIYGLLRILLLMGPTPVAWGGLVLALGAVSGLLGVAFAIGQHDLKRLLAYHSVENIGIILMGLGTAMIGRSTGNGALLVLGLAGSLLHVWNHALFKSLLFFGAGAVLHATHTRELDRLGGLGKAMPMTAALFLVGAVAICGLPPLNGFVSELLVYLGFFQGLGPGLGPGLAAGAAGTAGRGIGAGLVAAPILAAIGALALACFVKVYGVAFLGSPRSGHAALAHEAPLSMRLPMLVLAAACALIGLAPALLAPLLDRLIAPWSGAGPAALPALATLAPLGTVGAMSTSLAAACAILFVLVRLAARSRAALPTWDCGYAAPGPRMQYTASSFARGIVGIFAGILRPRVHERPVEGNFPRPASTSSEVDDAVLDRILFPAFRGLERASRWFRRFQQGLTQEYILFVILTLVVLLATQVPLKEILARLVAR
jgi:hydrogenase-4 component B